jgi:hypothetical protein
MIIVNDKHEGTALRSVLQRRFDRTDWLAHDTFAEFEHEAQSSGPCTIFKFEEGKSPLLIVHCHRSDAILIIKRDVFNESNRATTIHQINLNQGAPRYMAFEALTGYLKRSGWLSWNPRLYAHFPLFLMATAMQVEYAMYVEELDAEDYDQKIYFGDKKPTLRQRWARICDVAKLYTLTHD